MKKITFNQLESSNLYIDALYVAGKHGNIKDEPLSKLMKCRNQGGFRYRGTLNPDIKLNYLILYSTMDDRDWPDTLDCERGTFVYYGDNKKPGHLLHDTPLFGNLILKNIYDFLHNGDLKNIPPIFIFTRFEKSRSVVFRGLAVPGAEGTYSNEDLVAIWKTLDNQRFQNYRALFTILDIDEFKRSWIEDVISGNSYTDNAPSAWLEWINHKKYLPLQSVRSRNFRNKHEQTNLKCDELKMINYIYNYFTNPYEFEKCAAEIFKMHSDNVVSIDLTRPTRDGGRDGIGKYRIGHDENSILVDFALEAKRYNLNNSVGVKETSRLISRIKHRQFGVLVTTSYVAQQAYQEIKEDNHPILIISAIDIINILKKNDISDIDKLKKWIANKFDLNTQVKNTL